MTNLLQFIHYSSLYLSVFDSFSFNLPVLFFSLDQPPVSSCDVLVVPVGHSSMARAINVVQKLWSAGISADIAYDVSQVSGLPDTKFLCEVFL